ncbi:MAG: DUF853 domain-containing protein [Desulfovibrio sp.]|nr:DUF853 domain-containing protein [Desulfovibrio sp.]
MLTDQHSILTAMNGEKLISLTPRMANRHGLITGATGTGKTVTLQGLAEGFSQLGVPVFLSDVKGDLSGLAKQGAPGGKIKSRIEELKLQDIGYSNTAFPVTFWDVFGREGHPFRTSISDMGPILLSRLLDLNDIQSGILSIVFRIADDQGLLLLDLRDLQSMLRYVAEHRKDYETSYGHIATQSVGAIQRSLLELENQGGNLFFGEPALDIADIMLTDAWGNGIINILHSAPLINSSPRIYSSLLLWLLSELYERLPECGDLEKPKLVFFFDEAHLLFEMAERVLLEKIEQIVRLIRSRGVGVYFISQNPADIPDTVLGQLGNRVQHALRAFTPKERKAIKSAADAFRPNPAFSTIDVIEMLGVGEALVSFLDEHGVPTPVERALILPPESFVGPLTPEERHAVISNSSLGSVYNRTVDRYSAFEALTKRHEESTAMPRGTKREQDNPLEEIFGSFAKQARTQITRQIGRELGKTVVRGILGTLFGKK